MCRHIPTCLLSSVQAIYFIPDLCRLEGAKLEGITFLIYLPDFYNTLMKSTFLDGINYWMREWFNNFTCRSFLNIYRFCYSRKVRLKHSAISPLFVIVFPFSISCILVFVFFTLSDKRGLNVLQKSFSFLTFLGSRFL